MRMARAFAESAYANEPVSETSPSKRREETHRFVRAKMRRELFGSGTALRTEDRHRSSLL